MDIRHLGKGPLFLHRDPQVPLEAATKNYVDNTVDAHADDADLHLTPAQSAFLNALTVTATQLNYLSNISADVQGSLDAKLSKSGGTMTGRMYLSADPADLTEAANKNYVDTKDAEKVSKTGDTLSGYLTLHADPSSNMHAATRQYVVTSVTDHASDTDLHLTSGQRSFLAGITASAAEVNHLVGVTSGVQGQLDTKLDKSGGTLTGNLTLSGAPSIDLHAASKKYVDDSVAGGSGSALPLVGGTMTGYIILHADPTNALHPATKQYVDSGVSTHASNSGVHLTSGEKTLISSITVSASVINYLDGVTQSVQTSLDDKLNKSGGSVTGDVTMTNGSTIYNSKVPTSDTELVNKSYVDALQVNQRWENPVLASNLLSATLSAPPGTPVDKDSYIVGPTATGLWVGLEGRLVTYSEGNWIDVLGRVVAAGDRFGVKLTSATSAEADLTANVAKIVTMVSGDASTSTPYVFTEEERQSGSTTVVYSSLAPDFNFRYTFSVTNQWVGAGGGGSSNTPGAGLQLSGNILNVVVSDGLAFDGDNKLFIPLDTASGLSIVSQKLNVLLDGATLTKSSAGIRLASGLATTIADAVTKSGTSSVSGSVTVEGVGAVLRFANAPAVAADVTNKTYVDDAITAVNNAIGDVVTDVAALMLDSVTKTYVDTQDELSVKKTGSTMTGFLTLHAEPTSNLHPATKSYVDSAFTTHEGDKTLHLTSSQNTFLDAITATASEINFLVGVSSAIQSQLDDKLAKTGGTMSGDITLGGVPIGSMGAINKGYVDTIGDAKLDKAGGTMTGDLVLVTGTPPTDNSATNKAYVASLIGTHAGDAALHLTSSQNTLLDGITATATEINYVVGVTSAVQEQLNAKLDKAGGTMTGDLSLAGSPTANAHAANKSYVDSVGDAKIDKAGGTMTGDLVLVTGTPATDNSATNKAYVLNQIASAISGMGGNLGDKLDKSGGTMTGYLTLHADPMNNGHASTKQYVDQSIATAVTNANDAIGVVQTQVTGLRTDVNALMVDPVTKAYVDTQDNTKLSRTGGSMTGYMTLHADPTNPLHPASKQYVDNVALGLSTKAAVRLATTTNLSATYSNGSTGVNASLTGTANGALSVDGKACVVNDRILVRLQTDKIENGDYFVVQVGNASTPFILQRNVTADQSSEIPKSYFFVNDGATLKGTGWTLVVNNPDTFTVGTDIIDVNQFYGAGSMIAGAGMTASGNTFSVNAANSARIVVNADDIDLATTGITPGTYTRVVMDAYGRATGGSNPTTLGGYGITDAQPLSPKLSNLAGVTTRGLIVLDSTDTIVSRKVAVFGVGLSINDDGSGVSSTALTITSDATHLNSPSTVVARDASGNFAANIVSAALNGNAATASLLLTSRNFSITGSDVQAAAVGFTGGGNVALSAVLQPSGVTAGTYTKIELDAKGRGISGSNPTTLAGYGINNAYTKTEVDAIVADLESKLLELHSYLMARIR